MLRVTVDTNVLSRDMQRIREAIRGHDIEIAPTTVTLREHGVRRRPDEGIVLETGVWNESPWGEFVWGPSPPIFETLVLDESRLDMAVLGDDDAPSRFEAILRIIGDGSFPPSGKRDQLTTGQRRQLRDAMILEAHLRDGRDVLISNDVKAFGGRKRERLEALLSTRVMTADEFCDAVAALGSSPA